MEVNNYIEKLESVLKVVKIHSPYSFSWFNEKESFISKFTSLLSTETLKSYFINMLQLRMYKSFYCIGYPLPMHNQIEQPLLTSSKFIFSGELSNENTGKGYRDNDWVIHSIDKNNFIVQKNGLKISVNKKNCIPDKESIEKGESINIRMPKELRSFSPGFYVALSDEYFFHDKDSTILRFYWNLVPDGAQRLMKEITSSFNEAHLPFRLKMVDNPSGYIRSDSAVLYLNKCNYENSKGIIENIYFKLTPYLKKQTPVFTKTISPGLGLAESPTDGTSFGMHRCQILAEAILNAFVSQKKTENTKLEFVMNYFAQKKINMEAPYLNPGSNDKYVFNLKSGSGKLKFNTKAKNKYTEDNQIFLNTAFEIGQQISRRAIWSDQRCNWLGMDINESNSLSFREADNLIFKTLGPDIYSGTGGIALFLAELQTLVNEDEIRRTAVGAAKQTVSIANEIYTHGMNGLYSGSIGTALVSAYTGTLLNEDQLLENAWRILQNVIQNNNNKEEHLDLISGNAGSIIGLLILQKIFDSPELQNFAIKLGNEIILKAVIEEEQCSWKAANFPKQKSLTGFSHGAAGIGYALLELFRATGELKYKEFAIRAFNYECKSFNKERNNWPDFRGVPAKAKLKGRYLNFPVFWCHGAPGIALSRVRAYQILQDEKYKPEALTALEITMEGTRDMLKSESVNFSLCHGLAGNADVLLNSFHILQNEFTGGLEMSKEVALTGIERYAKSNHQWPFGMMGNNSPGLMLGLSGVGHFYLRLFNHVIPSFLIFENEKILQRLSL